MEMKHAAGPRRKSALAGSQSVRRGRPHHLWTWKLYSNLRPSHQKCRLAVADWKALSESQRQRVRLAVFCLMNEGVAGTKQSTSTDGSLTVLHCPDTGKELGSRHQPRADCTVTQNKKKRKLFQGLLCYIYLISFFLSFDNLTF